MAELRECVEAEEENIRYALRQLPNVDRLSTLSDLELAGTAALLHSIYNGLENVLKQVIQGVGGDVPTGSTWHRDLLLQVQACHILAQVTVDALRPFMAFRHFFSHAYVLDLDPARMELLVGTAKQVVDQVLIEVLAHINSAKGSGT
jgi:hypothetical protein